MTAATTRLQVLSAKVSADERAQLDALAQLERTSVSSLVRRLLLAAVQTRVDALCVTRTSGVAGLDAP